MGKTLHIAHNFLIPALYAGTLFSLQPLKNRLSKILFMVLYLESRGSLLFGFLVPANPLNAYPEMASLRIRRLEREDPSKKWSQHENEKQIGVFFDLLPLVKSASEI